MKQDAEVTPEHVLYLVRPGMSPAIPIEAAGIQSPSAARIVETFRARFAKASDAGVWKRLSMVVMEAANPFDVKARRQVRQEAIILGALVFASRPKAKPFNLTAATIVSADSRP
jgi:hypothetical protein